MNPYIGWIYSPNLFLSYACSYSTYFLCQLQVLLGLFHLKLVYGLEEYMWNILNN
jgi:hypothetical protein